MCYHPNYTKGMIPRGRVDFFKRVGPKYIPTYVDIYNLGLQIFTLVMIHEGWVDFLRWWV